MCSILPASLHCQFMIALLDFLNVYLLTTFCSLLILVTSVDVRYLAYVLLCSYSQRLKTFPIYLFEGTIWRYSRDDKDLKHFQYIYLRVPYESTPETSRAHHITYLHLIIARGSYYLFEPSGQVYILKSNKYQLSSLSASNYINTVINFLIFDTILTD